MSQANVPLLAFNRGYISKLALARVDIKRTALSAEVQDNWMPRVLGSASLRPGWGYIGESNDSAAAFHIPFIFATDDTAILEMTDEAMRVYDDDDSIITRPSVSTTVTNGDFSSGTGWTDADETGATSTITGGELVLTGTDYAAAIRRREVTVSGDENTEHALRIIVTKGYVTFLCGSSSGDDDYISRTTLGVGEHSLAFTPTGNFWVQFEGLPQYTCKVNSIQVNRPAPWKYQLRGPRRICRCCVSTRAPMSSMWHVRVTSSRKSSAGACGHGLWSIMRRRMALSVWQTYPQHA